MEMAGSMVMAIHSVSVAGIRSRRMIGTLDRRNTAVSSSIGFSIIWAVKIEVPCSFFRRSSS